MGSKMANDKFLCGFVNVATHFLYNYFLDMFNVFFSLAKDNIPTSTANTIPFTGSRHFIAKPQN